MLPEILHHSFVPLLSYLCVLQICHPVLQVLLVGMEAVAAHNLTVNAEERRQEEVSSQKHPYLQHVDRFREDLAEELCRHQKKNCIAAADVPSLVGGQSERAKVRREQ